MNLKAMLNKAVKARSMSEKEIERIAREATRRAVEKAAELTPQSADLAGTNTRGGHMKQLWATSSDVNPVKEGKTYVTKLANDAQYASYVNDGHRMDRHFVPGLYINPYSGKLERDPGGRMGGIMVGTKTKFVPGLFMVDAAEEEYSKAVKELSDGLLEAVLK